MTTKKTNIKDLLIELEKINEWFQSQDLDIEEGIIKLKKAEELMTEVRGKISNVENEFIDIRKRLETPFGTDIISE